MPRTYLDHNATSPLRPEARAAMVAAMDTYGNPSSIHAEGRKARAIVEQARETVARICGVDTTQVIFTSGGTEAAAMLLAPGWANGGTRPREPEILLTGATEHACVLRGHSFRPEHTAIAPAGLDGVIKLDALKTQLAASGSGSIVAVQGANNETGVTQPLDQLAALVHEAGAILVCDAVQLPGKEALSSIMHHADAAFISAHKFGGPKGTGAILLRSGHIEPVALIRGGGQEHGRRSGTENVAGIAGMAAALAACERDRQSGHSSAAEMQTAVEQGLKDICPSVCIIGENTPRLANTTCFAVPGLNAETLLMAFDLDGVAVSTGSACSSGRVSRSHVLDAMGVDPVLARSAIRVSTGWTTSMADIERFLDVWRNIYGRLRTRAVA